MENRKAGLLLVVALLHVSMASCRSGAVAYADPKPQTWICACPDALQVSLSASADTSQVHVLAGHGAWVLADCGQWRFKIRSVEQGVDSRRYFRAHGWAEATALQVDHNSKSHSLEFTPVRGRPVIGAFSRCEKGQFAAEIQWITRDGFSVSGREGLPPDVIGPMKVRCKQLGIDGLEDGDVDTNDD